MYFGFNENNLNFIFMVFINILLFFVLVDVFVLVLNVVDCVVFLRVL